MTTPQRGRRTSVAGAATIALCCGAASGQDGPPVVAGSGKTVSDWTIQFEPSVWYVAPGGKLRLPGSAGAGGGDKLEIRGLNQDSPRLSPYGELHARNGDWRLAVSGFRYEGDDRGTVMGSGGQIGSLAFAPGEQLRTSLTFTSVEMLGAYRFFHRQKGEREEGGFTYVPMLEAQGGVRVYDIGVDVRGPGGSTSSDQFFAEPFVGARFSMDLAEHFAIDVETSLGGFNDGSHRQVVSWNALVGFQWYPVENLGVQVGYRQLAFSLIDGSGAERFDWRGAMAGLYFGASLRY
jgi:hypothetical protein